MWQYQKTQFVIKLKNSDCNKTKEKIRSQNSNCDRTQKHEIVKKKLHDMWHMTHGVCWIFS